VFGFGGADTMLAHERGDYDEAERQHQRALDIFKRLGDQADKACTYSQLGILGADRGGPVTVGQVAGARYR